MTIYVYNRDGKTKEISHTRSSYYTAWNDFKKKYDWQAFYVYDETEERARENFWRDLDAHIIWENEFEITKWEIQGNKSYPKFYCVIISQLAFYIIQLSIFVQSVNRQYHKSMIYYNRSKRTERI